MQSRYPMKIQDHGSTGSAGMRTPSCRRRESLDTEDLEPMNVRRAKLCLNSALILISLRRMRRG